MVSLFFVLLTGFCVYASSSDRGANMHYLKKGGKMAENQNPRGDQKDPLEELGERVKAKIAAGRVVFEYVVRPKAKEVLENMRGAVEGGFNKVRDSLDPTRGLERNAREVKAWFQDKGLTEADAAKMVVRTVRNAVAKPTETKTESKKED